MKMDGLEDFIEEMGAEHRSWRFGEDLARQRIHSKQEVRNMAVVS